MILAIALIIVIGILAWILRPRERLTGTRRQSILATVIPIGFVAIAAIVFQLLQGAIWKTSISDISNTLYILGLCLIGVAILVSIGFTIKRKGEIAKGIGFSICISIIAYIVLFGLLEWLSGA
jgi:hypothetical protein